MVPVIAFALILIATAAQGEPEPRAVALAPHLAELAYAAGVGERLVGTVAWSDYPPEVRPLPGIGDAFRLDLEKLLQLDATHALAWRGGTPPAAAARLEALDIEIHWVEIRSLDDIAAALADIGAWLARPAAGEAAAVEFLERLDQARGDAPGKADLSVFFQVSRRPLFALGGRHVINGVFELCGAVNVFAGMDTEAVAVNREAVLAADPDVIIAASEPGVRDVLVTWRERNYTRASRCGRLLEVDPERLVRPTPRILDGAGELCDLLDKIRQTSGQCE